MQPEVSCPDMRLVRKFRIERLQQEQAFFAGKLRVIGDWHTQFNAYLSAWSEVTQEIEVQRSYMELEAAV